MHRHSAKRSGGGPPGWGRAFGLHPSGVGFRRVLQLRASRGPGTGGDGRPRPS